MKAARFGEPAAGGIANTHALQAAIEATTGAEVIGVGAWHLAQARHQSDYLAILQTTLAWGRTVSAPEGRRAPRTVASRP